MIARPCHTYGPYFTESDNRVYAQFIRNILNDEDIVMKSRGEQFRSWLYVVDCAVAMLLLLTKGNSGEAYNVANEESNITIRQLAEEIAKIGNKKVVFDLAENGNTTPITKAVFSTEKLNQLGWKPLFSIEEGLAHWVEGSCNHHKRCDRTYQHRLVQEQYVPRRRFLDVAIALPLETGNKTRFHKNACTS